MEHKELINASNCRAAYGHRSKHKWLRTFDSLTLISGCGDSLFEIVSGWKASEPVKVVSGQYQQTLSEEQRTCHSMMEQLRHFVL